MLGEMASAAPRRARLDPLVLARRLRRLTLLVAAGAAIWFFTCFGAKWVPAGMDTVPEIPPGSYCILDKRQSTVQVGSNVFLEVPGTGLLLSRVAAIDGDTVTVRHPNPRSTLPDSTTLGPLPRRCLCGVVLGVFASGDGGQARGR